MASSTNDDSYAYFSTIQTRLYGIFGSILVGIGSVGAILSCCVFAQKTMRQNPGSIYFIAFNVTNFLSLIVALLSPILSYTINIDPSLYNVYYCKIRFYIGSTLALLSPVYLVLASIDRTLVTSRNALLRQRSTHRLAYWSISIVTVICSLFYIHILVRVNIQEIFPGFSFCFYDPGDYSLFATYSQFVLNDILPPLLMSVFAVLTLRNLRTIRIHLVTVHLRAINTHRSKDRQLAIMLLAEIVIYILFSSTTPMLFIYSQSTQYQIKTVQEQAVELFLEGLFFLLSFIPFSINFYMNLVVSKSFRLKMVKILLKLFHHCHIRNGKRTVTVAVVAANRPV